MERQVNERSKASQAADFGYLDVFEQQQRERKKAQQEFQRDQKAHNARLDARKPAFFQRANQEKPERELTWREQEHEAHKKFQKKTEMNFDSDKATHEQLREFFKIS